LRFSKAAHVQLLIAVRLPPPPESFISGTPFRAGAIIGAMRRARVNGEIVTEMNQLESTGIKRTRQDSNFGLGESFAFGLRGRLGRPWTTCAIASSWRFTEGLDGLDGLDGPSSFKERESYRDAVRMQSAHIAAGLVGVSKMMSQGDGETTIIRIFRAIASCFESEV
jgi:hypothetical protein